MDFFQNKKLSPPKKKSVMGIIRFGLVHFGFYGTSAIVGD